MRLYLLIPILLLFCKASHAQTPLPEFTALKSGKMKLEEFKKLDSLELNTKLIRVVRYTIYIGCADANTVVPDSVCKKVYSLTVEGNSLKGPDLLKILNKFSPPFNIIFDDIKVMVPDKTIRTIMNPPGIRIL